MLWFVVTRHWLGSRPGTLGLGVTLQDIVVYEIQAVHQYIDNSLVL